MLGLAPFRSKEASSIGFQGLILLLTEEKLSILNAEGKEDPSCKLIKSLILNPCYSTSNLFMTAQSRHERKKCRR